jgi:hypothetical protein
VILPPPCQKKLIADLSAAPINRVAIGWAATANAFPNSLCQIVEIIEYGLTYAAECAATDAFHFEMLIKIGNGQVLELDGSRHGILLG